MLEIGDQAPEITLPGPEGREFNLASATGPVVLFFYPRDDTSGCTKEAIAFSAQLDTFKNKGVSVFGISKDSLAKHDKFAAKHDLTVPLLSDEHSDVCERYGVWKEKKMYGKTFMGIERTTFLISATGQIAQIWRKVKVDGHEEAVLAEVENL